MGVKLVFGRKEKISNAQVKFAAKDIKAKCITCELSVKRVLTVSERK